MRTLYAQPIPGKFYANGNQYCYNYKDLGKMTGIAPHVVGEIVLNQI